MFESSCGVTAPTLGPEVFFIVQVPPKSAAEWVCFVKAARFNVCAQLHPWYKQPHMSTRSKSDNVNMFLIFPHQPDIGTTNGHCSNPYWSMIVGDHTIQYFGDCHDPFCEILLNTQHKGTTVGVAHCSNPLDFQAYVGAVYMLESHLNLGIEAFGLLGTGNCKRWTKDVVSVGHG